MSQIEVKYTQNGWSRGGGTIMIFEYFIYRDYLIGGKVSKFISYGHGQMTLDGDRPT